MADATSGHGVKIYVTLDPSGSPGTFTHIEGLVGEIKFKANVASKKVTPHEKKVDEYTYSEETVRDEISCNWNYDPTDADHVALMTLMLAKTKVGFRKLGPGGV